MHSDSREVLKLKAAYVALGELAAGLPKGSLARKRAEAEQQEVAKELDDLLDLPLRQRKDVAKEPRPEQKSAVEGLCTSIALAGLPPPEREFKFHSKRRWRLDLAWPDEMVAVEVHGGVWTNGRHTRGAGFTRDREKMNEAQLLGWRVLEVTSEQVKSGQALAWIEKALGGE